MRAHIQVIEFRDPLRVLKDKDADPFDIQPVSCRAIVNDLVGKSTDPAKGRERTVVTEFEMDEFGSPVIRELRILTNLCFDKISLCGEKYWNQFMELTKSKEHLSKMKKDEREIVVEKVKQMYEVKEDLEHWRTKQSIVVYIKSILPIREIYYKTEKDKGRVPTTMRIILKLDTWF